MAVCYIVGAGDCPPLDNIRINEGDTVIAADGGLRYLRAAGINPDSVIGDFDSLGSVPEGGKVTVLPAEKDVTDMYAAAEAGVAAGYTKFKFYGWSGGRLDHTLANIQLCASLVERGYRADFVAEKQILTALHCGEMRFDKSHKGYISVFAFSDECLGVTLKGLKYTLDNVTLSSRFPLGVSNEFTGTDSLVKVSQGTLIVVFDA